ncbi:unnamed protein product [Protopolystoma xenopodis]|uniref:Uncharacterized protein n=1 Tax=Protopolystoma xenopodis TaxID=117903 RepID=A0A3S5B311_9PLAT|nr:unnamed protein product [Protopolystoma xenopodis]
MSVCRHTQTLQLRPKTSTLGESVKQDTVPKRGVLPPFMRDFVIPNGPNAELADCECVCVRLCPNLGACRRCGHPLRNCCTSVLIFLLLQ